MLKRLKDLSSTVLAMAALGCMGTSAVQAQEVKKQWFAFASGNQPRATEKLVQKDIETRFAAHQAYGPFSWEMRGTTTLTDKIIYDYAIKPAKLIKTDWTYRFDSQAHGSEEALFEALRLTVPKEPACPAPQVSMTQAWTGIPGGGAGAGADGSNVGEQGVATVSYHFFNAGSATASR
ncbi:hypothetical protein [Stenotrophomonas sp. S4]